VSDGTTKAEHIRKNDLEHDRCMQIGSTHPEAMNRQK